VGRIEESQTGAARRQPGAALLGNQTGITRRDNLNPGRLQAPGFFFSTGLTSERITCSLSRFAAPFKPSAS
jgi:hypothetical protein